MPSIPPGLHNLPDPEYFALDLPSSSGTKTLLHGTNAHLAAERETPREENEAFTIGAMVHALLLAPETVADAFIRIGRIDRRTTAGKAEWADALERAALTGARIISDDQTAQAEAMTAAVRANSSASRLIDALTHREVTVIGEIGGRPAKAKIDGIISSFDSSGAADPCVIVDLKTTLSAAPGEFASSAAKFGYWHQAAWYRRLTEQHLGIVDDFVVIAVEKTPPHLCAVYRMSALAIHQADERIDALAARWWAVQGGDRTGYQTTISQLDPPAWWTRQQTAENGGGNA